jgi:hypothetical protein
MPEVHLLCEAAFTSISLGLASGNQMLSGAAAVMGYRFHRLLPLATAFFHAVECSMLYSVVQSCRVMNESL